MLVCPASDGASVASERGATNSVIEPLRSTVAVLDAIFAVAKVEYGLTSSVELIDAAVFYARSSRNAFVGDADNVRLLAPSGGNLEAVVAMGHGRVAKVHGDAAVVSEALVISLTRLAGGE